MCGQLDKIIPIISPKIEWKIHFNEWSIYHWICVTTEDVTSFIVMSKNPYSKDIFNFSNYIFVSPFKTITWLHLVSSKVYNRSTSQVMLSSHSKIVDTGRERERDKVHILLRVDPLDRIKLIQKTRLMPNMFHMTNNSKSEHNKMRLKIRCRSGSIFFSSALKQSLLTLNQLLTNSVAMDFFFA